MSANKYKNNANNKRVPRTIVDDSSLPFARATYQASSSSSTFTAGNSERPTYTACATKLVQIDDDDDGKCNKCTSAVTPRGGGHDISNHKEVTSMAIEARPPLEAITPHPAPRKTAPNATSLKGHQKKFERSDQSSPLTMAGLPVEDMTKRYGGSGLTSAPKRKKGMITSFFVNKKSG